MRPQTYQEHQSSDIESPDICRRIGKRKIYLVIWTYLLLLSFSGLSPRSHAVTPSGVQFTAVSSDSLSLSWVLDNPSVEYPLIVLSTASDFSPVISSGTGALGQQTTTYYSVLANTIYYFKVKVSTEPDSNYSSPISTSTLAAIPFAPTVLSVSSWTISIGWHPNGNPGDTPFEVSVSTDNFTLNFSTPMEFSDNYCITSATISPLEAATTYYFRVRARSKGMIVTGFSDEGSGPTWAGPLPEGISASVLGVSSITWSWDPQGPAILYYRVYRASNTQFITSVYDIEWTETDMATNTVYGIRVSGVTGSGEGPLSQPTTDYTLAAQPAALQVVSIGSVTASLQWSASGNPAYTPYEMSISTDGFAVSFSTPIAFSDTHTLTSAGIPLEPAVTYYFRVRARNSDGVETLFSSPVSSQTLPGMVESLLGSAPSTGTILWTWAASGGPGVFAYNVYREPGGPLLDTVPTESFTDTGLSTNTEYGVRVSAVDFAGEGELCLPQMRHTRAAEPGVPAGAFISVGETSMTVTWDFNGNPPGTEFRVEISTSSDYMGMVYSDGWAAGASRQFNFLEVDTTYYAQVMARNGNLIETGYVSVGSTRTLTPTFDESPPGFDDASFRVANATGGFVVNSSTVNTSSPDMRILLQDSGSGIKAGHAELAVTSYTAVLLHFSKGSGGYGYDSSGNHNHASLTNALWTSGMCGNAVELNGSDAFAEIAHDSSLNLTTSLTLEAWVYVNSFPAGDMTVISKSRITRPDGYIFPRWDAAGNLTFQLHIGGWNTLDAGPVVSTGVWTHLAATFDGEYMRVYKDGSLIGEKPQLGAVATNDNPLVIGDQPGFSEFFDGKVDEVRLLKNALSPEEVAGSYISGGVFFSTSGPGGPFTLNPSGVMVSEPDGAQVAVSTVSGTQLRQGTENYVKFVAQDRAGNTSVSTAFQVLVDTIAPSAVGDLEVVGISTGQAVVRFGGPTDNEVPLEGYYALQYSTPPGQSFSTAAAQVFISTAGVAPGETQEIAVTGLHPNTTHTFVLWTRDIPGNWSGISNQAGKTTLAGAVESLYVSEVFVTSATLSWQSLPVSPSTASAEGYLIEASTSGDFNPIRASTFSADIAMNSFTLPNLKPGATHHFRLGAVNPAGVPNYAFAGSSRTVDAELGIAISTDSFDLGATGIGSVVVIPTGVVITNLGNIPQTYALSASTTTPGSPWIISNDPDEDRLVLQAGFNDTQPAQGAFGDEDKLSILPFLSDSTRFAIGQSGEKVPSGEDRKLWMVLQMPLATSTTDQQAVQVVITAIQD